MSYNFNITGILSWPHTADEYMQNIFAALTAKYQHIRDLVFTEFGPDGFLVLILFALFILLIIIIYIKLVADTFRAGKAELQDAAAEPDGVFYSLPPNPQQVTIDEKTDTNEALSPEEQELWEKERELSAELIRMSMMPTPNDENSRDQIKLQMRQDAAAENNLLKEQEFVLFTQMPSPPENNASADNIFAATLNLLSRGVSENKIAQTLYFYFQALFSEEDILQIISSIRDFIGLCNSSKFADLPERDKLPTAEDALYSLAFGNIIPCLTLMQALINRQMQEAESKSGLLQDLSYAIAANYSCIIGNLALFKDRELAHNSFELATELSPKSVTAWNRLGDMYMLEDSPQKALIAFQNVLDIGDRIIYAPQIANAQKYLGDYYQKLQIEPQAADFKTASERFYELYGMYTPLSAAEKLVYQTIMQNSAANLPQTVSALLLKSRI